MFFFVSLLSLALCSFAGYSHSISHGSVSSVLTSQALSAGGREHIARQSQGYEYKFWKEQFKCTQGHAFVHTHVRPQPPANPPQPQSADPDVRHIFLSGQWNCIYLYVCLYFISTYTFFSNLYLFRPNREPCPVPEPDNIAARFWNQLPGSRTGCPVRELDKHVSI